MSNALLMLDRAQEARSAFQRRWRGRPLSYERSGLTLVVDAEPGLIVARDRIVGVDFYTRLFDGDRELMVDPHRRIINPPCRTAGRCPTVGQTVAFDPEAALAEVLFGTLQSMPNPKGWRTLGTVTTVFDDVSDGQINSLDTDYSLARSGSSLNASTADTFVTVGQWINAGFYYCWEGFLSFDTSGIPDGDTVTAVVLSLTDDADASSTDFTVNARSFDWGAALTTADWIAGASLSAQTLLATFATSGWAVGYNAFTSEAAFAGAINKTDSTRLILSSTRHEGNNIPSGTEYVSFKSADETGTSSDPKLDITHSGAGGGVDFALGRGMFRGMNRGMAA